MNEAFWAGLILGAVASMVGAEILDVSAWAAPRVVRAATRSLPESARVRYEEEWLAELASFDGLKLVKLAKAVDIWRGSLRLGRELNPNALRFREYVTRLLPLMPTVLSCVVMGRSRSGLVVDSRPTDVPVSTIIALMFATASLRDARLILTEVDENPDTMSIGRITLKGTNEASRTVAIAAHCAHWISITFQVVAELRGGTPLQRIPGELSRFKLQVDETP